MKKSEIQTLSMEVVKRGEARQVGRSKSTFRMVLYRIGRCGDEVFIIIDGTEPSGGGTTTRKWVPLSRLLPLFEQWVLEDDEVATNGDGCPIAHLGSALWRRNMKNHIGSLKGHFILCGYGRVGQEIAGILFSEKADFVVIDKNPEAIAQAVRDGRMYVAADAATDIALKDAGIERAKGIIVALGNDSDSTYVILSARQLNHDIFIEARVSAPDAESKLKLAGADRTISPYTIGARRMAMLALQPEVTDFIDIISLKGQDMHLENLTVGEGSPLAGKGVSFARTTGKAVVLAVNKKNGQLIANPSETEIIQAGDAVIAMGSRTDLRAMEGICENCKLEK